MTGIIMRGRIIYIMGASGAGKDSLIKELRHRLRDLPVIAARRYITRPLSAEGEPHIFVSHACFEKLASTGYFSLHWASHGCRYGISSRMDAALERGVSLLINGSRTMFPLAATRYPDLLPVLVTAPPCMLRERLRQRGRESDAEIEERMCSAVLPLPEVPEAAAWIRVENSDSLERAAAFLEQTLRPLLTPVRDGVFRR